MGSLQERKQSLWMSWEIKWRSRVQIVETMRESFKRTLKIHVCFQVTKNLAWCLCYIASEESTTGVMAAWKR